MLMLSPLRTEKPSKSNPFLPPDVFLHALHSAALGPTPFKWTNRSDCFRGSRARGQSRGLTLGGGLAPQEAGVSVKVFLYSEKAGRRERRTKSQSANRKQEGLSHVGVCQHRIQTLLLRKDR